MKIKKFKEYNEGLFSKKQNLEGFKVGDKIVITKCKHAYESARVYAAARMLILNKVAEILYLERNEVGFKIGRGLPFPLNTEDFSMRHATPEETRMYNEETQRYEEKWKKIRELRMKKREEMKKSKEEGK